MLPMQLRVGPPVSGANYFPRPDVEARIRQALERGHVSLMAPRRTGKTSTLIALEGQAREGRPHWRINLETCKGPEQWVEALMTPLAAPRGRWSQLFDKVASRIRQIDTVEIDAIGKVRLKSKSWESTAQQFLEIVLDHERPSTFLLDEFPILVDEMAQADVEECKRMLRWFREWRQETRDTEVRFLVTGSIGLDAVVERHQIQDTVNDFEGVDLPPLGKDDALELLTRLARDNDVELTRDLAASALELIGAPWPYFLQILVAELQECTEPLDREVLERIYRERLVAGPRNEYAKHMWTRLKRIFDSAERRLALAILDGVGQSPQGLDLGELTSLSHGAGLALDSDDRLRYVLQVLEHDGYLLRTQPGNRRVFFSNLLRDSWKYRAS